MQPLESRPRRPFPSSPALPLAAALAAAGLALPLQGQCGDPLNGSCCVPHTEVGCNDRECCKMVCAVDPFCCDVGWDEYCAGEAVDTCSCLAPEKTIVAFGATVTLPSGLIVDKHDLAIHDPLTGEWSTYFDGEDVGFGSATIAAAAPMPDGTILFAAAGPGTLPGLVGGPAGANYNAYQILRFFPTSLGTNTAGSWSFHFDGPDVGLTSSNRALQSIARMADGSLVVALKGSTNVPGVSSVTAYDLLRFVPTSLGSATAGTWSKFFEGADVGLSATSERLDAAWMRPDGRIVFSAQGAVSVPGYTGAAGDLLAFTPTSLGTNTAGSFASEVRAAQLGLPANLNVRAAFRAPVEYPEGPRPGGGGGGSGGPTSCGAPGTADCCTLSATPFCSDISCCTSVCAVDPLCCAVSWDEFCVGSATQLCTPCMPAPRAVMSFGAATILPGNIQANGCDLAAFNTNTGTWSTYFDGDDVGLSGKLIAAAARLPDGDLVLAIEGGGTLAGLAGGPAGTAFDAWDLVRFRPSSLGDVTAGSWSFHFDGSDVGLGANADAAIRSLGVMSNGSLLIATLGNASLPGVGSFVGHDLVRFTPTSLGAVTAGTWSMHLDGSDIGLSSNTAERLDTGFPQADGSVILSTRGNVSATGFSGARGDLFRFTPTATGWTTAGTCGPFLHWYQLGILIGGEVRAGFVYVPEVPFQPRPVAPILFDRLPSAAVSDEAVADHFKEYLIVYQGVDPDSLSTGIIDADLVIEAIRSQYGDNPSGYGVIDFEDPFINRLEAGPGSPTWNQTVQTVVNVLQRCKAEFPQVQWTMYSMPLIRYWIDQTWTWADVPAAVREAQIQKILVGFDPVLRECDWFNTCAYDWYELSTYAPANQDRKTAQEVAHRQAQVEVCNRFNAASGLPRKPIIPMISPMFWEVGQISYNMKMIGSEEILRDSVRPLMEAGADGVAFWTGLSYWVRAATSTQDLGVSQVEARYAFTMDFYGGVAPTDWTLPAVYDDLSLRISQHVRVRMDEARSEIQSMSLGNPGP